MFNLENSKISTKHHGQTYVSTVRPMLGNHTWFMRCLREAIARNGRTNEFKYYVVLWIGQHRDDFVEFPDGSRPAVHHEKGNCFDCKNWKQAFILITCSLKISVILFNCS